MPRMQNIHRLVVLIAVFVMLFIPLRMQGQDETPTAVTNQNRAGNLPYTSSIGTDVESVDVVSGNLKIRIPIVSLKGRGLDWDFVLRYDTGFFIAGTRYQPNLGNYEIWNAESRFYLSPNQVTPGLGWEANIPYFTSTRNKWQCTGLWQDRGMGVLTSNYIYVDKTGAKYPLLVQGGVDCDGDVIADSPEPDLSMQGMSANGAGVYLANGTYVPNHGIALRDSNGNMETLGPGWPDTLGRTIVTQQNGTNQVLYKVYDSSGTLQTYTVNYAGIAVQTNFGVNGIYGTLVYEYSSTRNVITSIVLPNGQSYGFQYEMAVTGLSHR